MNLVEYFNEALVIDDECIKIAIEKFGKNNLDDFFYNIDRCIDENLMQKMKDYLFCKKLSNELKGIGKESNLLIKKPSNEQNDGLDATGTYFNEISKYPVLNLDEEKKYCQELQLGKNITILKEYLIDGKKISFIDLGKIFVSLHNNEYAPLILDCLMSFYYIKENGYYQYINYYLQLYYDLVKKIGYYPNRDELRIYFNKSDKYKLLEFGDSLDKITLLEEIKKYLKYSNAREIMINCNLRLVANIAKKYANNIDIIDLINEGNLGLLEAVARFDVSLGYRFSTYAVYWIKQKISRYVYHQSSSVKISEDFKYKMNCFKKKLDKLEQKLKKTLTVDEIAFYLKMPVSKVIKYFYYSYTTLSLDEIAFNEEDGSAFIELIFDKDYDVEELSFKRVLKSDIENLLSKLTPKEALVIKSRFGIGKEEKRIHTFQEIGDELGITRERVRQIEKGAIKKLKTLSNSSSFNHLSEY